jgi:hypothetical protein
VTEQEIYDAVIMNGTSDFTFALRAEIQEGIDAADRGQSMDGDEFFAELNGYLSELTR